jgi:hypothetical protein
VVEFEEQYRDLGDELREATHREAELSVSAGAEPEAEAQRAVIEVLRESRDTVRQELASLAAHEGHPERWVEQHGEPFVKAIAAQDEFRARELAEAGRDHPQPPDANRELKEPDERVRTTAQPAHEAPDAGRDLF